MKLLRSLAAFGTDDFNEVFEAEMDEFSSDLPLQDYCDSGGWPDDLKEATVTSVHDDDDTIYVSVAVSFTESIPSSCAEINHEEAQVAYLDVEIRKSDGSASATSERSEEI